MAGVHHIGEADAGALGERTARSLHLLGNVKDLRRAEIGDGRAIP
jgi:hypothetical protein